jgi:hypothetical protein
MTTPAPGDRVDVTIRGATLGEELTEGGRICLRFDGEYMWIDPTAPGVTITPHRTDVTPHADAEAVTDPGARCPDCAYVRDNRIYAVRTHPMAGCVAHYDVHGQPRTAEAVR